MIYLKFWKKFLVSCITFSIGKSLWSIVELKVLQIQRWECNWTPKYVRRKSQHSSENPGGEGCLWWVRGPWWVWCSWHQPQLGGPTEGYGREQQTGEAHLLHRLLNGVQNTWVNIVVKTTWIFGKWRCYNHPKKIVFPYPFITVKSSWEELIVGVQGTD